MTAEINAVGVDRVGGSVTMQPAQRGDQRIPDSRHRNFGAQGITHDRHVDASLIENLGNEAVHGFIATLPVAAVQIHQQRRAAVATAKQIERFAFVFAIAQVEQDISATAVIRAARGEILQQDSGVRPTRHIVVFGFEMRIDHAIL